MMYQSVERALPATGAELAHLLRAASAVGRPVVPWGAGTLQRLGAAPPPGALALRTTALDRIVEYHPPDLTITVEASVALEALDAALAEHGQWLPWLPPAPGRATVGGLLAAGVSGPLRLGYGTPRDWALGMRVALADGRLVKSGGKVVKNVAGYDTHKLHIGALGTLGVIAEVTFKVFPRPERSGALLAGCASYAEALALAERLRERPLAPVCLALLGGGVATRFAEQAPGAESGRTERQPQILLAVRFDGASAAVERQLRAAADAAAGHGASVTQLSDEQAQAAWRELSAFAALAPEALTPSPSPNRGREERTELLIRAGARPSALGVVIDGLERHAPDGAAEIVGYGGVGLAHARWRLPEDADAAAIGRAVAALRAALANDDGYAMIEDAPDCLRPVLELWGAPPPTLPLMRALKVQWDPQGILNRGRYVGGL
jgi:glycolate oxidase FAD binding subunit